MRRATRLTVPLFVITLYFVASIGSLALLGEYQPEVRQYLPVGGLETLLDSDRDTFEPVTAEDDDYTLRRDIIELAIAVVGTAVLMIPISWVYFITSRSKDIDHSLTQTIVVLPIVVTGVANVVQHSLALAFSLAGVVAAVRFRFSLDEPAHALYIFAAIGIGLSGGVGALDVGAVISIAFVYVTLILWKLRYGDSLNGPFLSFLAGRDRGNDEGY